MEQFIETISLSAILVIIAFVLIGVGLIFTGKQKIKGGTCGRDPTKKSDDSCGTGPSCSTCGSTPHHHKRESEEENDKE